MEFQKWLFGTFLNNVGIAKYSDSNTIILVAKTIRGKKLGQRRFETLAEYREWIDSIVDDETAIYNRALAVELVQDALCDDSPYLGYGGYGYGRTELQKNH